MNTRGVTARYVIIIIVAIVGFVAILGLLFSADLYSAAREGPCSFSIVLRSLANAGTFGFGGDIIALRCETEKICMTSSGEECTNTLFGKKTAENPITHVSLRSEGIAIREEIIDRYVTELFECHTLLGQGELDFMPRSGNDEQFCFVCSRLALDDGAKEIVREISFIEIYQRMRQRQTNGKTYLESVYGVDSVNEMARNLERVIEQLHESDPSIQGIEDLTIDLTQEQAIIARIAKKGYATVIIQQINPEFSAQASIATSYSHPLDGSREYYPPAVYPYTGRSLQELRCRDSSLI